ncbi:MAG: protealysin inhibitor emfourin [Candidatus Manganitrophaceae bacterium]
MKIDFTRSGGFAGVRLSAAIDTEGLSAEERERLCGLVDAADFDRLPSSLKSTAPGADRFQYRLKIEEGGGQGGRVKEVVADESAVPETLRPLLEYLTDWARTKRSK